MSGADRFAEPAPLLSTTLAPAPAGAQTRWLEGTDGVRLRVALFPPAGAACGSVIINPGRTEFIEKYFEVVGELTARGFTVLVHDWRGQGLSDRLLPDSLLGHAGALDDLLNDHRRVLDAYADRLPQPWIGMAHSMGGGLITVAALRGERRYARVVHSAPMFGLLTYGVPRSLADATVVLRSRVGAGAQLAIPIEPGGGPKAKLSHDKVRTARWHDQIAVDPRLQLGGPTWSWLRMALEIRRALTPTALSRLDTPTLFALAGAEAITDNAAVRRAAAAMPRAEVLEIPGSWHEVLMETDEVRAQFWSRFDRFVSPILRPSP